VDGGNGDVAGRSSGRHDAIFANVEGLNLLTKLDL
jgi:hypothetical protein